MSPSEQPVTSPGSGRKAPRRIACLRCRRRKKRCDHGVPACGECSRTGSECIQYGASRSGSFATIPIAYLQQLESQVSEQQQRSTSAGNGAEEEFVDADQDQMSAGGETAYPSPFDSIGHDQRDRENILDGSASGTTTRDVEDAQLLNSQMVSSEASESYIPPSRQRHESPRPTDQTSSNWSEPRIPVFADEEIGRQLKGARSPIGEEWMDHYANIYFRHVQPQWSFLDENSWRRRYNVWKTNASGIDPAHQFILQLVLATGALISSSFRAQCPHLVHATELHDRALRSYLGHITQNPSALIRTHASLLMLLYAFHGPSPDAIPGSLMLVLMNCSNLMSQLDEGDQEVQDSPHPEQIKRHTIMTCHILNEAVSSAWMYPRPFMVEFLDDAIFQYASRLTFRQGQSGFFEHLFQLRCIQSRIRHHNKKLQNLDPNDQFRETCRVRLKEELRHWKESIQAVTSSSPRDNIIYHDPGSFSKLYDYSLSILMQERPCMMGVEEIGQLVECCSDACRTFQTSQQNDSVIYCTWSALMYQFRLGIMLVYCYAMTPPMLRTPVFSLDETLAGLGSCHKTLSRFATRWPRATVFLQAYQLLVEATFDTAMFGQFGDAGMLEPPSSQSLCTSYALQGERKAQMQRHIIELKLQHVHEAVITQMEDMVNKPPLEEINYDGVDFAPNMYLGGFDLFHM